MKKNLFKTLFFLFIGMLFVTPLLFSLGASEVYEFPKMYFIYFVGATIITVYLLRGLLFGFGDFKKPSLPISIFITTVIISTIFSNHLHTSLWGYYTRFNGGLVSYLIFFGIYVVAINLFNKEKMNVLLEAAALGVLPISLFGIFQAFDTARVFSTFGQPNWLAAYLVMCIPLVVRFFIIEKEKYKKYFWFLFVVLSIGCLFLTRSISGMLGFIAAVAVVALSLKIKKSIKIAFVTGFTVLLLVGLMLTPFKERVLDAINLSGDQKSYNISDSGLIRTGLWKGSAKMFISSPKNVLLGIGPENFPYEYPFFREDILNYSSEWDFILNKPHNYFLEIAVESGVFALLAYLFIILKYLKSSDVYLKAGFFGFAVTNIFGWPTVSTALLFWMWLAYLDSKETSQ